MNIKNAQKKVDQWINKHGVRYFNELTNMAILSEEVGEVARSIARKYGEQSLKSNENEEKISQRCKHKEQQSKSTEKPRR